MDDESGAAGAGGSSASSSSSAARGVWSRHCVSSRLPLAPYPSSGWAALLRSVRHPDLGGSMSARSMAATLDSMSAADREHWTQVLLPFAAHLALRLPDLFPLSGTCLPLLRRGVDQSVTLSADQCASIVAAQLFSLFPPKRETAEGSASASALGSGDEDDCDESTWPHCNMDALLSVQRANVMAAKQLMISNYLARLESPAEGVAHTRGRFVTFHRRVVDDDVSAAIDDERLLGSCSLPLSVVDFRASGCIEDAAHSLQADFANRFIGGGVLYTGCVQEEIRFCLSPECLVSMVFCEAMEDNEAIAIIGTRMFSHYGGYGTSLSFAGDCADEGLESDEWGRSSNCIVAIDAVDYCHCDGSVERQPTDQWRPAAMQRETLKAYVGLSFPQAALGKRFQYDTAASGNWGCGAFGGYVPLKFVLQWLSASLAGRGLIYFPFANPLAQAIPALVEAVRQMGAVAGAGAGAGAASVLSPVSVGELWRALCAVAPLWGRKRAQQVLAEAPDEMFQQIVTQLRKQRQ